MTPEQIEKNVENYVDLLKKKEKLQNRLISLSGRDSDQEIIIMQRLQTIERTIEFIDYAIYESDILTSRESCAVERRSDGWSIKQLSELLSLSYEGARVTLNKAYKKMAQEFNKSRIA